MLGVERVGMEENFFDLGGHSLLAMQVVSRVGEVMGVEIRLREVFEAGNVRKLAERVEERIERGEREGGARAGVKRRGRTEHVPLSYEQQRLYFLQEFDEHSWYYNVPVVLRLKGRVEEEGVEWSLREIVKRHEVLRTRIEMVGGEAEQKVEEGETWRMKVEEVKGERRR